MTSISPKRSSKYWGPRTCYFCTDNTEYKLSIKFSIALNYVWEIKTQKDIVDLLANRMLSDTYRARAKLPDSIRRDWRAAIKRVWQLWGVCYTLAGKISRLWRCFQHNGEYALLCQKVRVGVCTSSRTFTPHSPIQ